MNKEKNKIVKRRKNTTHNKKMNNVTKQGNNKLGGKT